MSKLADAKLTRLEDAECRNLLAWAQGTGTPSPAAAGCSWLLAHCDDGVTWGQFLASGWSLSSGPFSHISPPLTSQSLQQLRLFGPNSEVLIWRTQAGFLGRRLEDDRSTDTLEALRPDLQEYVVLGDRVVEQHQGGFTVVGDATGSRHAVPLHVTSDHLRLRPWSLRLKVVHYFEQDEESGVVRVAASRLADLK